MRRLGRIAALVTWMVGLLSLAGAALTFFMPVILGGTFDTHDPVTRLLLTVGLVVTLLSFVLMYVAAL